MFLCRKKWKNEDFWEITLKSCVWQNEIEYDRGLLDSWQGKYKMDIVSLLPHSLLSAGIMLWSYRKGELPWELKLKMGIEKCNFYLLCFMSGWLHASASWKWPGISTLYEMQKSRKRSESTTELGEGFLRGVVFDRALEDGTLHMLLSVKRKDLLKKRVGSCHFLLKTL